MIAPSAMFIEMAADRLANMESDYWKAHKEMFDAQMREVQSALPNQPIEFYSAYCLGLETARVLLEGMPKAVLAGVMI